MDKWLSETETASLVNKTVRTLRMWRKRGVGPPYAYFGRTPKYRESSVIDHYRQGEITPARMRKGRETRKAS